MARKQKKAKRRAAKAARTRKLNVALIDLRYHGRLYRHGSILPEMPLREASQMRAERKIYARDEPMADEKASENATNAPAGDAAEKPARDPSPADEALTPGKGGVETR